jgi:cytochrome c peroxidase
MRVRKQPALFASLCLIIAAVAGAEELHEFQLPNNFPLPNSAGFFATYSTRGSVDFTTHFHKPLGTNGRDCGTCHLPTSAWSIKPSEVKLLFALTGGTHPLFRTLDANNPAAKVETVRERKAAYSMMLNKGLFRRTFAVPAGAEFEVIAFDDPYGVSNATQLSLFRRPLVTTSLLLINGVAWENRTGAANAADPHLGLIAQARGNATGAQQGTQAPPLEILEEIVAWETSLSTAQVYVNGAGRLDVCGARGGPEHLSQQTRVTGLFDLYDAWISLVPGSCSDRKSDARRAQIARGQHLFNEALSATGRTCRGCHNVANNGTNFNGGLFNIGVSAGSRRTPDMPLFTLRKIGTTDTIQSTDPGRAMITGRWDDIDKFKTPTLRALASHAPYFHNGAAATLRDVIHHYEESLEFSFDAQQEADLIAFLNAL